MNSPEAARLLAAYLNGEFSALEILSGTDPENLEKPGAVVSFDDFAEHDLVLGNWEGAISVRLRTVPEDTPLATADGWANSILGRICDLNALTAALGIYKAVEAWEPQVESELVDGVRESRISATVSLVQLA